MTIGNLWTKIVLTICVTMLSVIGAFAQDNVIDEVIWVVGDEAILRSEVEEQRLRNQHEGVRMEGDPYCVIPEQIALQKLYLHQAELDSVVANENTVNTQVEMRLNYFITQIGSKEKMEEYFRKPMAEIREDMYELVHNQMVIQQMQQQLVSNLKSTPAEIAKFYEQLPADSIPLIPTQVEVQLITIEPPVPQEEIDRIKERLREFAERVNNGSSSFSMLARLYSEDTQSATRGGELGFVGKGQLVPEFAAVAFALTNPNHVSRVVETEFGYHIIQLIERRGDRVNCRHILLRPRASVNDKEKAINLLDSVATLVRTEKMTYDQAAMIYSQDKNTVMNAGLMTNPNTGTSKFEYQELPQEVAKVVYGMKVGEISEPFTMMDPAKNKEVCVIVKLKSRTETHKANLKDDYQVIKQYMEDQRNQDYLNEWIKQKQAETYIDIAPEWKNCDFQYPGWVK